MTLQAPLQAAGPTPLQWGLGRRSCLDRQVREQPLARKAAPSSLHFSVTPSPLCGQGLVENGSCSARLTCLLPAPPC